MCAVMNISFPLVSITSHVSAVRDVRLSETVISGQVESIVGHLYTQPCMQAHTGTYTDTNTDSTSSSFQGATVKHKRCETTELRGFALG